MMLVISQANNISLLPAHYIIHARQKDLPAVICYGLSASPPRYSSLAARAMHAARVAKLLLADKLARARMSAAAVLLIWVR